MTPAVYGSIGFGRAVMANQIVDDLIFPDQDGIDAGLAEQRALYQAIMRDDFAALMRSIPARKLNPMRPCTADDIRRAYQLILHRDPESEDIIDRHAGKTAVFSLMQGLMQSKELHELAGRLDHP